MVGPTFDQPEFCQKMGAHASELVAIPLFRPRIWPWSRPLTPQPAALMKFLPRSGTSPRRSSPPSKRRCFRSLHTLAGPWSRWHLAARCAPFADDAGCSDDPSSTSSNNGIVLHDDNSSITSNDVKSTTPNNGIMSQHTSRTANDVIVGDRALPAEWQSRDAGAQNPFDVEDGVAAAGRAPTDPDLLAPQRAVHDAANRRSRAPVTVEAEQIYFSDLFGFADGAVQSEPSVLPPFVFVGVWPKDRPSPSVALAPGRTGTRDGFAAPRRGRDGHVFASRNIVGPTAAQRDALHQPFRHASADRFSN